MTFRNLTATSIFALAAFSNSPVFADVTANDVWENFVAYAAASGQSYTAGSKEQVSDTLTITDLKIAISNPELEAGGTIPMVKLREVGDGTVEITTSDNFDMKFAGKATATDTEKDDTDVSFVVSISQSEAKTIASGEPDAISYASTADKLSIAAKDFADPKTSADITFNIDVTNLVMDYLIATGDMTKITSSYSADAIDVQLKGKGTGADEGKFGFNVVAQMSKLAGNNETTTPKDFDPMDLAKALADGYAGTGGMTYGASSLSITASTTDGDFNFDSSSQGGNLKAALGKDGMAFDFANKGISIKAGASSIPLPEIAVSYDESAFGMTIPVVKSDEIQDFALNTQIKGLTISDALWSMFDVAGALPRDPATLILSAKGKMKQKVDLFSPTGGEQLGMMMATAPIIPESLDIETLQLDAVGVALKGDGALTFDTSESAMATQPRPVGNLNLSLTGASALLANLKKLGLIGDQEIAGFGMFSSMLAKPGPTDDSLVTELEFQKDGKVLANGNPLPF